MEYMRIAENHPTPKSDKKAIIRGALKSMVVIQGVPTGA
jgi:hypothetical protein